MLAALGNGHKREEKDTEAKSPTRAFHYLAKKHTRLILWKYLVRMPDSMGYAEEFFARIQFGGHNMGLMSYEQVGPRMTITDISIHRLDECHLKN